MDRANQRSKRIEKSQAYRMMAFAMRQCMDTERTLDIGVASVISPRLKRAFAYVRDNACRTGESMASSMEYWGVFTKEEIRQVNQGEEKVELPFRLDKLADKYLGE